MSDIATMIGSPASTPARWKQGTTPNYKTVVPLARALGCNPEWLATGRTPQEKALSYQAGIERPEPVTRLAEMPYAYTATPTAPLARPAATIQCLVEAMTLDELLNLSSRLGSSPATLSILIEEIRRRTLTPAIKSVRSD